MTGRTAQQHCYLRRKQYLARTGTTGGSIPNEGSLKLSKVSTDVIGRGVNAVLAHGASASTAFTAPEAPALTVTRRPLGAGTQGPAGAPDAEARTRQARSLQPPSRTLPTWHDRQQHVYAQ